MKKFWNFIRDDAGERVLRLEGPIDEDNLWGDAITPEMFRDELNEAEGDVTVWLNSPGGNVFAANEIYNMLCEYQEHKGKITVKIDAIAASAASVVAMAGSTVLISPVGMLLIHDPMTVAMGNTKDMEKAIETLNKVKESIIGAYQKKTGLSHNKIAQLMSDETWLPAKEATALGFADGILFEKEDTKKDGEKEEAEGAVTIENEWKPYHARLMDSAIWAGLTGHSAEDAAESDAKLQESPGKETDVEPSEAGVTNKEPPKEEEEKTEDPDEKDPEKTEHPDEDTPPDEEPSEESPEKEDGDPKREPKDTNPEMPVIGMDGKTKDGAMPYELLRRELDLLR